MKILSASQIRNLDAYTIEHEPISSVALMDRASSVFTDWFCKHYPDPDRPIIIFCGSGNNGGDGLAVARLLNLLSYNVEVFLLQISDQLSPDAQQQFKRLPKRSEIPVHKLNLNDEFPGLSENAIIIDAIFGSGLNRPISGYWSDLITFLNLASCPKVAIDVPSGLFVDQATTQKAIAAENTLSFQLPKLAFFFPENHIFLGKWEIRSIGLHEDFLDQVETNFFYTQLEDIQSILRPRSKFDHKGSNGHALIIAGSEGKFGAAILATKACLRSGAGLTTTHLPKQGYPIMQIAAPEAMVHLDRHEKYFARSPKLKKYQAVGVGPGIGKQLASVKAMGRLLRQANCPLVLDADALNLLSEAPDLKKLIPPQSILTPHPKEFSRLFGETSNSFDQLELAMQQAKLLDVFIVLKGAYTAICTPMGKCYFNSTGNPGMATGGSGDVLTGILTGLLAQGYDQLEACRLGVYLHGLAGDLAAKEKGEIGMIAGDLIEQIGPAFLSIVTP